MSDPKKPSVRIRRLVVRLGLVVVFVALVALVFVTGKGHTVLVDNKDVDGTEYKAFDDVTVGIDRLDTLELMPGDRDLFKVKGQRHSITLEIMGQSEKIVRTLVLPLDSDMVVVNLPRLAKGVEPYWETFVPLHSAPVAQEADQAFTSPGGVESTSEPPSPPTP